MKNSDLKPKALKAKNSLVRIYAISLVLGSVVTGAFLLLFSFIITKIDVPQSASVLMSLVSYLIGGFTSGYACGRINRQKGFINGIFCGFILFTLGVLSAIMMLALDFSAIFSVRLLVRLVAILLASAIGGIIGVNKPKDF